MTSPSKLAHIVYRTRNLPRLRDWYIEVLTATVSFGNDRVCFLTYDDEHHRIAIISDWKLPEQPERRPFDHVAFAFESLPVLLDTHDRLCGIGIEPFWTVNHGPTTSFYYRDPDENQIELQVDNLRTSEELFTFFQSDAFAENPIGVDVDPYELRRRYESGEPLQDVLTRQDVLDRARAARAN